MTRASGERWVALGALTLGAMAAAGSACSDDRARDLRPEEEATGGTGPDASPDAPGAAGTEPGDAGPDTEPPPATPRWPEATRTWAGARAPAVAVTPGGQITVGYGLTATLTYQLELDPATSPPPVELATGLSADTGATVLLAASATDEGVVGLDTNGTVYWLRDGAEEAESHPVGFPFVTALHLSFTATRPVALLETNFENTAYWLHGFVVPEATAPELAPVSADTLLATRDFRAHYHGEAPSFLELEETATTLTGLVVPSEALAGPSGYANLGAWSRVRGDLAAGGYLVEEATGTFPLPIPDNRNASWLTLHDLGGGAAALTWHQTPEASQVFDVMLARVAFDASGAPSIDGAALNVSDTAGLTDESDQPLVLPRGDGSFYVAWRESAFGPRVALYDPSFTRQWLIAPDTDLRCRLDDRIAAAVDPDGRLHLVATVMPQGTDEVWYWVIGE